MIREYRKGNWTLEETLVLIDAKKLDEERRTVKNIRPSDATAMMMKASGELRWKWIEDYCWKKGCLRSQNQCNDKWDNLMRDFKKVREFERRRRSCNDDDEEEDHKIHSYWKMDKFERKSHNLPSSMLAQIYEALNHVMEAKFGTISVLPATVFHTRTTAPPPLLPPPPPPPLPEAGRLPSPTEETSANKKRSSEEGRNIYEEISASVNVLADAMSGYEEREKSRHRELYSLHQKRYKIEESKIEMERQGFNGLVDAINNLSNSILAFTSQRTTL